MVDQYQFYLGYKWKHGYKYQLIVIPDNLVSSLMGPFIGRQSDWKMVELSGLKEKLCMVNQGRRLATALYLYSSLVYATVYTIMRPYKNYPGRPRTVTHNRFNKMISELRIEIKYDFAIHQNL